MTEQHPTHLYVGRRADVVAEVGEHKAIYQGKYLLVPCGKHDWDAEGADTKEDVEVLIREYLNAYPEIQVVRL